MVGQSTEKSAVLSEVATEAVVILGMHTQMSKSAKLDWHIRMRVRACVYSSETCQKCKKPTDVAHGVIHHLKYPPGVYEKDVEPLIDEGICMWLCKACHNQLHIAETLEESKGHLKSGGYCKHCGELVFGGWNRAKTLGLDYCICKKCYKAMKALRKQEQAGQKRLL